MLMVVLLSAAGTLCFAEPPNIIFMLADDLGYGDLTCYNPIIVEDDPLTPENEARISGDAPNNTPIVTPYINSLATDGARLTSFYSAAPMCSPSRRALLTARYPNRLGEWAEGYASAPFGVEATKDPTIGMWLKAAGYATACYGKWNIGETLGVSWPGAHGFDDWLIIDHNTGYFQHTNDNSNAHGQEMLFKTGGIRETSLRGKYLTDIFADKALEFIEAKKDVPFFLYLPWSVPHNPLQSPTGDPQMAYDAGPAGGTSEGRAVYVEMVEHLDSRIGDIFTKLHELGLTEKTFIIFTSDNGGQTAGNNWPLSKAKQWLEEGGVRVPTLMKWPDTIPAGAVTDQPSIMMDAAVTVLTAAEAMSHVPADRTLDGVDLMPVLENGNSIPNRNFGWRRRDWSKTNNGLRQESFRSGDWKFLRSYDKNTDGDWVSDYTEKLFDLSNDLGESNNLATSETETLNELRTQFEVWRNDTVNLNAEFLIWNPDQLNLDVHQRVSYQWTVNPTGSKNIPNPSPLAKGFNLFDYAWDNVMEGKVLEKNDNAVLVSDPVVLDGVMSIEIQPNTQHPYPNLYREGYIDTTRFQIMKIRMRISGAAQSTLTTRALLRHSGWSGDDILFEADADGAWHEYAIDLTRSSAWEQWTSTGRIGLQFPHQDSNTITVAVDHIRLESRDGFLQLSLLKDEGNGFNLSYPSQVGRTYSLYHRESLTTGDWNLISSGNAGSGKRQSHSHSNVSAESGFYKLVEE